MSLALRARTTSCAAKRAGDVARTVCTTQAVSCAYAPVFSLPSEVNATPADLPDYHRRNTITGTVSSPATSGAAVERPRHEGVAGSASSRTLEPDAAPDGGGGIPCRRNAGGVSRAVQFSLMASSPMASSLPPPPLICCKRQKRQQRQERGAKREMKQPRPATTKQHVGRRSTVAVL